jgi:chloramphenicol 3-O-phosphotransferase
MADDVNAGIAWIESTVERLRAVRTLLVDIDARREHLERREAKAERELAAYVSAVREHGTPEQIARLELIDTDPIVSWVDLT